MARGGIRKGAGRKRYGSSPRELEVLNLIKELRNPDLNFDEVQSDLASIDRKKKSTHRRGGASGKFVEVYGDVPDRSLSYSQVAHILNMRGYRNQKGNRFKEGYVSKLVREHGLKE